MMADSDTNSEASIPSYNPKQPYVTWLNHEDGFSGEYTPFPLSDYVYTSNHPIRRCAHPKLNKMTDDDDVYDNKRLTSALQTPSKYNNR
jgi:hypothetical protein